MDLGQKGVFWFTDALTSAQLVELAQRTEEFGYAALWYPEALGYKSSAWLVSCSPIGKHITNITFDYRATHFDCRTTPEGAP